MQHRAEQGIQHRCGLKLPVLVGASMCSVNDYWIMSWAGQGWAGPKGREAGPRTAWLLVGMAEPPGEKFSERGSCPARSSVPPLCWLPQDTQLPAPSSDGMSSAPAWFSVGLLSASGLGLVWFVFFKEM